MEKTIFERIIVGELPSTKVFEDDQVFAILDITPVNKGHVLVVPKTRFSNIYDIPEELFAHIMKVTKKVAIALKIALNAEGINIIMNNEKAGGHITNHAHVHVIPRYTDDGYKSWEGKDLYATGEKEETGKKIREALS